MNPGTRLARRRQAAPEHPHPRGFAAPPAGGAWGTGWPRCWFFWRILFRIVALAEDLGIAFAFPTQIVHLDTANADPRRLGGEAA